MVDQNTAEKLWCPMEGTDFEGWCVENFATIRLKPLECSHKVYCEQRKKEMEKIYEN